MKKKSLSLLFLIVSTIISLQFFPISKASSRFGIDLFWTPNTISNWTTLESFGGFGDHSYYNRCCVNSNGSSVQIVVRVSTDGNYKIAWQANVLLERASGSEVIYLCYGDWGQVGFYNDTVDDGYFTYYYDLPPNSGPYDPATMSSTYQHYNDTLIDMVNLDNLQAPIFRGLTEVSENVWEASVQYNLGDPIISQYTTTWHMNVTNENETSVKIYNNYIFNSSWTGYGSTAQDHFFMVESLQYYFESPSNNDGSGKSSGTYLIGPNTTTLLDNTTVIETAKGTTFGSIHIPGTCNVSVDNEGVIQNYTQKITACRDYRIRIDGTNAREEVYMICLNNLTSNAAAGNITRVWYDPEFSFSHLTYKPTSNQDPTLLILIIVGVNCAIFIPLAIVLIIWKKKKN